MIFHYLSSLSLALIFALLTSCGGGGGGSVAGNDVMITGTASKGPINQAEVLVYQALDASLTSPIGRGVTDINGRYSVTLDTDYQGLIVVKISGGSYEDEATGNAITLNSDDSLLSATTIDASNTIVAITPFTDLIYKHAQNSVAIPTTQSINGASVYIATQFGLSGIDLARVIPTDVTQATATNDPEGRYGTMLAAVFSQAISDSTLTNTLSFSDVSQTIRTYQEDLRDGKFDVSEQINQALVNIQNNSRIHSATTVIMAVSGTIAPTSIPNISINDRFHTYVVTTNIPTLSLMNVGGAVVVWSVSPSLPQGLSLNSSSGTISGIPAVITSLQQYIISATNTAGQSSITIAIVINPTIPNIANIAQQTLIQGGLISPITFTNTGGAVDNWTITPSLPSNLSLNNTTGIISGTPITTNPLTNYTVVANNITGSDSATIDIVINPSTPNIVDVGSQDYIEGRTITPLNFINNGGLASTWSSTPSLPSGLVFSVSNNNGMISGTPSTISLLATYTITAGNITGVDQSFIRLSVKEGPPILTNLSNKTYTQGISISPFSFTNTGNVATLWVVSPNLPSGLSINSNNGIISGTPLGISTLVTYTITAGNNSGTGSAKVAIAINPSVPNIANIAQQTYIKNTAINPLNITNTGGVANVWSITPDLNNGLTLNASSGQLSGTPNISQALTNYVITASNITGSDSANISIQIDEPPPNITNLNTHNYLINAVITPLNFTNNGGIANTWSINPALPTGLIFNSSNGQISGTPTANSTLTTYIVTASNNTGSDNASVQISINELAPTINEVGQQNYDIGQSINPLNLVNTGGLATFWSITPNLPSGLIFNSNIGQISGTPNITNALTSYLVTASNTAGFDTVNISIIVLALAPNISNIGLQTYPKDLGITPISAINTGGGATAWSISPTLPAGLIFNGSNGQISGTPSIISSITTYTITASNTTGSSTANIIISVVEQNKSISGQINAVPLIMVDSDINNFNAPANISNNTSGTAQNIINYTTIHGFVNNTPSLQYNINGRFANSSDKQDVYKVNLQAGQSIQLQVSDYANLYGYTGDLDLFLFNSNLTLVDYSYSITEFEQVTVPSSDTYYLLIDAYSGMSKYALSINNSLQNQSNLTKSMDFLNYQSVVKYQASNTNNMMTQTTIGLEIDTVGSEQERVAQAMQKSDFTAELAINNLKSYDKYITLQNIKKRAKQSNIAYAEPNYIYRPLRTPNDTNYNLQWHYPLINLPEAWDITTGQASDRYIVVAVIDTGVFLSHPDLSGKLISGYDFISSISNAGDGNGIDNDPDDVGDGSLLSNSSWHGTHVAGTIGAHSNNNQGVAGVSWDAKIMPLRVLGKEGGSGYDVAQAVLYAARLPNDSGTIPSQKADVINLSLGGGGFSQATQDVYTQARNAGVIIIAAAGNSNSSSRFYPASYEGVVSVSAVDYSKTKAPYSNFGDRIDIAAPGGNTSVDLNNDNRVDGVLSTLVNGSTGQRVGNYAFYQGTSMAAPHMAGVVALMKAVYPALTPSEFDNLLIAGNLTDEAGTLGRDDIYGYGVVNAYKAVNTAQTLANGGTVGLSPANINISPNPFNLGYANAGTLTIINTGQTTASITSILTSESWLSVVAQSVDSNQLGYYLVSIDKSLLNDGSYIGQIDFHISTGDTVSTTVTISVGQAISGGDIGQLIAVLVNTSFQVVQMATPTNNGNNTYIYSFEDVPVGRYYVLAGSDIDADQNLCQLGESCGAYPVSNALEVIEIADDNITGINFLVDILSSALSNNTSNEDNIELRPLTWHNIEYISNH